MNNKENLLSRLNNKVQSVLGSKHANYANELQIFYDFIKSKGMLNSALIELENSSIDFKQYIDENGYNFPNNYLKKIALCNYVMKQFAYKKASHFIFRNIATTSNVEDSTYQVLRHFFTPLAEYFEEKIEDNNSMLYLLDRYRHRTEWFHKKRLFEEYNNDTGIGEKTLTTDLREYLHNQGIDYPFSETVSPSGKPDIIGLIDTSQPLVLEVKLLKFDKKYGKGYIRKGLKQAYQYSLDYGQSIGYLLVFNLEKNELEFEHDRKEPVKSIQIANKVIYIVTVNIFYDGKSASEMKKPSPYFIPDAYLKNIDEDSDEV